MLDAVTDALTNALTWIAAVRSRRRTAALPTAAVVVVLVVVAIIGPPRDMWYMRQFPEWGHYGPGIAPVLAISAAYVILVLVGHGAMQLVAGPAREDRLARRPWEAASSPQ